MERRRNVDPVPRGVTSPGTNIALIKTGERGTIHFVTLSLISALINQRGVQRGLSHPLSLSLSLSFSLYLFPVYLVCPTIAQRFDTLAVRSLRQCAL